MGGEKCGGGRVGCELAAEWWEGGSSMQRRDAAGRQSATQKKGGEKGAVVHAVPELVGVSASVQEGDGTCVFAVERRAVTDGDGGDAAVAGGVGIVGGPLEGGLVGIGTTAEEGRGNTRSPYHEAEGVKDGYCGKSQGRKKRRTCKTMDARQSS